MSYSEIMLDVYEKEIETLQKKLSLVDDDIDKLKQEITNKLNIYYGAISG